MCRARRVTVGGNESQHLIFFEVAYCGRNVSVAESNCGTFTLEEDARGVEGTNSILARNETRLSSFHIHGRVW